MEMVQPILAVVLVLGLLVAVVSLAKGAAPSKARTGPEDDETRPPPLFLGSLGRERFWRSSFAQTVVSGAGPSGAWLLNWRLRLMRWAKPAQQYEEVAVTRQVALTPTHRLHVVRIHGREMLLVTHPHGCEQLNLAEHSSGVEPLSGEGRAQ